MKDTVDELLKEIAVKHHIAISRDDPILILQTINNRLLEESAKAHQVILNQHKEQLEEIALRWENEAKVKAERILNASLTASQEVMRKLAKESAAATAASAQKEIESALSKVSDCVRDAKRIPIFNLAAAAITFLAAGIALWAVFLH